MGVRVDKSRDDREITRVDESGVRQWRNGSLKIVRWPDVHDPALTRRNRAVLQNANRTLVRAAQRHIAAEGDDLTGMRNEEIRRDHGLSISFRRDSNSDSVTPATAILSARGVAGNDGDVAARSAEDLAQEGDERFVCGAVHWRRGKPNRECRSADARDGCAPGPGCDANGKGQTRRTGRHRNEQDWCTSPSFVCDTRRLLGGPG